MDIAIHGLNMKVPEQVDAYARKKLERLDRYLPGITDLRLELSQQNARRGGDLSVAQITIRHQRGAILRAEERATGGVEAAINLAVDKMYRRIERFKGKRTNHSKDRFSITADELVEAEEIPEVSAEAAATESEDGVIRHKQIEVSMMTEDEAIAQMELLGHTFFIFYNGDGSGMSVVYKRHDETYGVLIPHLEK